MKLELFITMDKVIRLEYISTVEPGENFDNHELPPWHQVSALANTTIKDFCTAVYGEELFFTPIKSRQKNGITRCVYELPKDPLQVMVFFAHFMSLSSGKSHYFSNYTQLFCQGKNLDGNENHTAIKGEWFRKIHALTKNNPDYEAVHHMLDVSLTFLQSLSLPNPYPHLCSLKTLKRNTTPSMQLLSKYFKYGKPTQALLDLTSQALAAENCVSLNYVRYLLWSYRQAAVTCFYEENCKGKLALDGNLYQENHTELAILRFGEFIADNDKRVRIVNIPTNSAFTDYYDIGCFNESNYENEMRHLFTVAGLTLAARNDMRKEIKFADAGKLIAYGFTVNLDTIKAQIKPTKKSEAPEYFLAKRNKSKSAKEISQNEGEVEKMQIG